MAESKFEKIWKDPVWSKVIATFIIALSTIITNFLLAIGQNVKIQDFFSIKVHLWIADIFILVVIIFCYYLLHKRQKWDSELTKSNANQSNFSYNNDTLQVDRSIFAQIKDLENTIQWLKQSGFDGSPFLGSYLDPIRVFSEKAQSPSSEFLNPQLEELRQKLLKSINEFDNTVMLTVSCMEGQNGINGYYSIPKKWQETNPERYQESLSSIYMRGKNVYLNYDELIRKGRKALDV
jgi:hypothetical protein